MNDSNIMEGLSLKEIQMQNPRFRAKFNEHNKKQHKIEQYKQKRIETIEDNIQDFDTSLNHATTSLNTLLEKTNYLGEPYLVLCVIQPIKNDTLHKMKDAYESYVIQMDKIEKKFDSDVRKQIEDEGKYDIHFKEGFILLSTTIFNIFESLEGVTDHKITSTLNEIFMTLSTYGAPPIELETEKTNIDQETIQLIIGNYRQNGYDDNAIIETIMLVYNIEPDITRTFL